MVLAGGWTNDCTVHEQTTPEPEVKVPIGTWSVRIMFQTEKTAQVEREMSLYSIDIFGISERRYKGRLATVV